MKKLASTWKAALLAAAFVASLGFGATQAFASPRPAAAEEACNTWVCPECGSLGGQWISGRCLCCG
jgi:hypothetical protein